MLLDDDVAGVQVAAIASHGLVGGLWRADLGQHSLRGSHHERVAVVRAEVEDLAGRHGVHQLLPPAERAERQSTADRLGQCDEVRLHPRAPVAPPHPAVMPVFTSSKMRTVPWRRVISRAACR